MSLSDSDLLAMLNDLESDRVERKESFRGDAPKKVREAVCAFANDLPDHREPGVVFIGAADDGRPTGLEVTDELLLQLASIKDDGNIVPPPTMTVEKRRLGGADMAVVIAWPVDAPPARYRGRIYVRIGPRRAIATAQDERILNERRRHRDRPFDVQPLPSATLQDLDLLRFRAEYLPAAVAPEVLEANERSLEQQLSATKMILSEELPTPTVLGALVVGVSPREFVPGAYVQFLRIAGDALDAPIVDEELIEGAVGDVLRKLDEKIGSHNRVRVEYQSSSVERRYPQYPMVALRQLTRNAILHRSYEGTHSPVRISWFDDRIEISSPGGPFGAVTAENFGQAGVTDYRNPNLAEAMRVLGFVQRFGSGLVLARSHLERNGNPPPEFQVEPSLVLATVRPAA